MGPRLSSKNFLCFVLLAGLIRQVCADVQDEVYVCPEDAVDADKAHRCYCAQNAVHDAYVNYASFYYCTMDANGLAPLGVVMLLSCLLFYFYLVGTTTDDFLVPTLERLSAYMDLSEPVAGVTLLALGNGAPDVFTSFAAFTGSSDSSLGVGEVVGAGLVITTLVMVACIQGAGEFTTNRLVLRDIFFTLAAVIAVFAAFIDSKVHLYEALSLFGLWLVFVLIVFIYRNDETLSLATAMVDTTIEKRKRLISGAGLNYSHGSGGSPHFTNSAPGSRGSSRHTSVNNAAAVLVHPQKTSDTDPSPGRASSRHSSKSNAVEGVNTQKASGSSNPPSSGPVLSYETKMQYAQDGRSRTPSSPQPVLLNVDYARMQDSDASNTMYTIKSSLIWCFGFLLMCLEAPFQVARLLTIPMFLAPDLELKTGTNVSDEDEVDPAEVNNLMKENKTCLCFSVCLGPVLFAWVLGGSTEVLAIVFALGSILSVLLFNSISKMEVTAVPGMHRYSRFQQACFLAVAFSTSILWVYLLSTELVDALSVLGRVMGISSGLLGLTFLAWGNCVQDLIADYMIAKKGQPLMAIGGVYGGPGFNIMVGLGMGFTYATWPNKVLQFSFQPTVPISFIFLVLVLVYSMVWFWYTNFSASRTFGKSLVVLYVIFLILAVLAETGSIGPWNIQKK
eukprot:gb/GEZN01002974.1/.p1 GENE.gb/GEZN01002974.1/~~gb/GEZN01002974.1/.p1  ORF type:complete len:674 (-),score=71.53 gb/GEZN01002974.1/:195-2216(-)